MPAELKRILLEGCVLVACGALFGLTLHHPLLMQALTGTPVATPRPLVRENPVDALPMPVLLEEVRALLAAGGLAVDARSRELFGAGHIEGAVSLPLAGSEEFLPGFLEQVALDRVLILYCSGYGCPDSFDLGVRLLAAGYREVLVFEGGYPEWQDAGLPVAGEGR